WTAVVALLVLPGACGGEDLTGPDPDDFGVLFVGNSLTYANDLPGILERLLTLGGVENAVVEAEARPNYGLPDHWVSGSARERIGAGGWSVVVLQQGPSATEGRPYLLEYAPRFADEIRSAGGRPALYMVWPARSRSFDFDGVLDSYRTAAEQVDGLFFPAGEAWRIAWERDPDLALYGPDGFHPSLLGTYLAALVMYEQLAERDPRELPSHVPTAEGDVPLEPEVAALLQEAAREANARHARAAGSPE
ncbi:MAG TPA: hypothetical protein VLL48_10225, partial [Longimicrobiales bacterium]|nr:hypothetical protein [Longimicrobiales bacterium]